MQFRYATTSELKLVDTLHPELASQRPDLARPAFANNPIRSGDDFPFIFYALDQGRVIGSRKATPDRARLKSQTVPWAWCFDTIVDASQHGKGIGGQLVKLQVEAFDERGYFSGAAFSAPAMMRIYSKLGYEILDFTPRMTAVQNARPFLQARIAEPLIPTANLITNMFFKTERLLRRGLRKRLDVAAEIISADEFLALFHQHAVSTQPCHWALEGAWVIARLQKSDSILKLTRRRSNRPSAVCIIRERVATSLQPAKRLSLMHFTLLDDQEDTPALLPAALLQELKKLGLDQADIITSHPALLASCSRSGFRPRGEGMTFVYKPPTGATAVGASEIEEWELTHFCSDGFLFD